MKWITHQTGAVLGAMALAMPLPEIAAASAGAIFPDIIDQHISRLGGSAKSRQAIFNRIHRGTTHWFGWWLALFLGAAIFPIPAYACEITIGFAFGALSHVLLDMLTPRGVPLAPFTSDPRISAPICATGNAGEYLFLGIMLAAGAFFFQDTFQSIFNAVNQSL